MKAIVNLKTDSGATLALRETPAPTPGPHDLLVAVRAAGLNRADLSRPVANPDKPDSNIAGMEIAGDVIAIGAEVKTFAVGDRVMSMTTKAYAEQALCDARIAMKIPARLDYVQAAAIPTFFSTAHDAIVSNGALQRGESVLIQGVAAGVGIAMIQCAKAMGASLVAGVGRDRAKLDRLKAFGLDLPLVAGADDIVARCMEATQKKGVDVCIDNVGKGALTPSMDAAAVKGRIVSVGRLGGKTDEIDLDKLALKRLQLIGVTFRTRSAEEKAQITRRLMADLGPLFDSGAIVPPIDRVFALDEALAAQDYMRANTHVGKIVLKV